jgi:hypothetical protein
MPPRARRGWMRRSERCWAGCWRSTAVSRRGSGMSGGWRRGRGRTAGAWPRRPGTTADTGCRPCPSTPAGTVIRADEAVKDAVFERRSCGTGTKGPRYSGWAMISTGRPREFLLIRRLISRPGQLTFYLCWAPEDRPATMTCFITIAGRRWPVEETFKIGQGHPRLGLLPGQELRRDLPAHRPCRARPAPRDRHPQRPGRRHHPRPRATPAVRTPGAPP